MLGVLNIHGFVRHMAMREDIRIGDIIRIPIPRPLSLLLISEDIPDEDLITIAFIVSRLDKNYHIAYLDYYE